MKPEREPLGRRLRLVQVAAAIEPEGVRDQLGNALMLLAALAFELGPNVTPNVRECLLGLEKRIGSAHDQTAPKHTLQLQALRETGL